MHPPDRSRRYQLTQQLTQHVDANAGTSRSPADVLVPTGREVERPENTKTQASTAAPPQPQVGNAATSMTLHAKTRKPHLPEWAQEAVANGSAERSKSPQEATPMPYQRAPRPAPSQRRSTQPRPNPRSAQSQKSKRRSSELLQKGNSVEDALVID